MRARRVEIVCWAAFACLTWTAVFDRAVTVAGSRFAREQILRAEQGQPTERIEDAFSPQVGAAAWSATGWAAVVAAAGAAVSRRRARRAA